MAQLAWLQTAPIVEGSKDPRYARIEKMDADGIEPDIPECAAMYLINYLFDIGPVEASGMGSTPLSSQEIESWQNQSGIKLQPWEFSFIRKLSRVYLSESQKSESHDYPAPYQPSVTLEKNREAVSMKIENLMMALKMAEK